MGKYFGTDGFRGRANETLTAEHAFWAGRFLGGYFSEKKGGRARVVVGKDTRRSSYMFEYALSAGITASGADVYLLHVTTTPSVSYVARTEAFDCGVMISASHNPFEDNGLKLVNANGEKMEDGVISLLEDYLDGKISYPLATGRNVGRTVDYFAGRNRYLGYLLSLSLCSYKGMRVGLDCANGSSWAMAKAVFDALGAKTFVTGDQPDGTNINLNCGSTHVEALQKLVREKGLDIGFAFDGDADRCICVDETGAVADGDSVLYLCAKYLKSRGELEGNLVVSTVVSNFGLSRALSAEGISCVQTRVGDRYVYEEMVRRGCMLGGEQSGHVIFRKYATTGDGLLTAVKVMEAVVESKSTLSALTRGFVRCPQVQRNVAVRNKERCLSDDGVCEAVARVGGRLKKEGRVLLRASGTEPLLRVLVEGEDLKRCEEYAEEIVRAISVAEEGGV